MLIHKAETEINGSYLKQRERHAKTLEVAQKEILTCIGMIVYERLKKIYVSLREEERACQVLAAIGVHALSRSFNSAVESKQGISNLELCYQEISRAEKAKELKREQRKLKKKKKKIEKKNKLGICTTVVTTTTSSDGEADNDGDNEGDNDGDADEQDDDVQENEEITCDANVKEKSKCSVKKLNDKNLNKPLKEKNNNCPCEKVGDEIYTKSIDGGYSSDPSQFNSRTSSVGSSLEGSEVSCCDDFCNHDHGQNKNEKINGNNNGLCNGNNRQYLCSNNNNNNINKNCNNVKTPKGKNNNIHINNSLCSISNPLSLEQMLEDSFDDLQEDEEKKCYIPDEVLMEFKCKEGKIKQERAELREYLRKSFAEMCIKTRGVCKLTD